MAGRQAWNAGRTRPQSEVVKRAVFRIPCVHPRILGGHIAVARVAILRNTRIAGWREADGVLGNSLCIYRCFRTAFAAALVFFLPPTHANNGLNLIGVGVESTAMGGADVAVARDTAAVSINPAGLNGVGEAQLDLYSAVAYAIDVAHVDTLGNDTAVSNSLIPLGGGGYARRTDNMRWSYGVGFFGQGGAGSVYKDLTTVFGTSDELSSLVGFGKLSVGASYEATDKLTIGVAIYAALGVLEQKVFPQTSVFDALDPARSFFGYTIEGARAENVGYKIGMQYEVAPSLKIGGTFSPEVRLPFEGGKLKANFNSIGLGVVTYRQVRLDGLALPREIALGAGWRARPGTLISFEVAWLNWSRALESQTLVASDPDTTSAPAELRSSGNLHWRDQTVVAVGIAQDFSERLMLYGGFNYGRNPAPGDTLSPVLAPIGQRHITCGMAWRVNDGWRASAGIEYLLPERVAYSNPDLPMPPSEERLEYAALHFVLSRLW